MACSISPAALEARLTALGIAGASWVCPASPLSVFIGRVLGWNECASEIGDIIAFDLRMRSHRAELAIRPGESVSVLVDGKPLVVGRIVDAMHTEWSIGGAA